MESHWPTTINSHVNITSMKTGSCNTQWSCEGASILGSEIVSGKFLAVKNVLRSSKHKLLSTELIRTPQS